MILEPEKELEALDGINCLAQLDDGSGIIEPRLISYLDPLDNDAYDMPYLRIVGQTLLSEMLAELREDERAAEVFRRNTQDSVVLPEMSEGEALQARVTQVVVMRLLRIITRMEIVELRNVVTQQCLAPRIPPVVRVALTLTMDILNATRLGAHPGDMMRVMPDYADQVLWLADDDLNVCFVELEMVMQQCKKDLGFDRSGEPGAA